MEIHSAPHEISLPTIIDRVKPLYESAPDNHGWQHISSVLGHVNRLQAGEAAGSDTRPWDLARVAAAVHDLDRTGKTSGEIAELLSSFPLSAKDRKDVETAIKNHNKPKNRWTDPTHQVSQILYDADKMDTTRERFAHTKNVGGRTIETTENDFVGYVMMVRDTVTSPVAHLTLTARLPAELAINPADQAVSIDAMRAYTDKLREVWRDVNMPMKRTVAKYALSATANRAYTQEIMKSYPNITKEQINKLTPQRRKWFSYIVNLKNISEYFLDHIDTIAEIARDPMLDKQKLASAIHEKLFVYDSMMQSIVSYPKARETDIGLLMDRMGAKDRMHENYTFFVDQSKRDRDLVGPEEFKKRRSYFTGLIGNRFAQIDHYSPYGNIDALRGGRRLLDKAVSELYSNTESSSILDVIDHTIEGKDQKQAMAIIKHFRQDALRASDRVNDALRTDRFIYSLVRGQTIDAPVRTLPYIYRMDAHTLGDNGLHYYNPTHPQALHAMKMRLPYEQMPKILNDSIQFFTQGMYSPEDYRNLMVDLFATVFDESEIKKDELDYLLTHVVVNEDAPLTHHVSSRFVSDGWLELDFGSRKDPLWGKANALLSRINAYSKRIGIIPPVRPYAVCDKAIDTTDDHIEIVENPESKKSD